MQNLFKDLEQLLLQCDDYSIDDKLNKPKIEEQALSLEPRLLKILLSHAGLKKHFFQDVDSLLIFDKVKFQKFISNKQFLPDSYTQFKNKIGLTANGAYLTESKEVVLDFPYKDCVLQGCQDKEDSKRDEVFFNETLAPDDIDVLLEPKALTNFKKYDATGEHNVTYLNTQDNLIIKGNNLLALHSLLSVYRGKVKLIYIDPPYNTGNDSFGYNDKFNHSTWLTFMKNRLEVARELLRDDGAIFISIDSNEISEISFLMKEIFGNDNYANLVIVKRGSVTGHKSINPGVVNITEYVLIFSKQKNTWSYNKVFQPRDRNERYNNFIINRAADIDKWEFCSLLDAFSHANGVSKKDTSKKFGDGFERELYSFVKKNAPSVIQFAYPDADKVSKDVKNLIYESKENPSKVFVQHREKEKDIYLINGQRILFYSDRLLEIDGKVETVEPLSDLWLDVLPNDLHSEGSVKLKKGKKPEKLLKRVIEIGTNKGDIVLDYHLGSGTTAAVAHKMGRQYIGIEQMDYIEDLAVTRLKKVIGKVDETKDLLESETKYTEFDNSGISKAVNWQGGGSFVYCELKQNNQLWVDKIVNAISSGELLNTWQTMQDKAQLSYKIDVKAINNNAEDFKQLSLDEQKRFLLEIIDKNQLYVNYTEIEDVDYQCSEEEKNLNNIFYGLK